MVILFLIGYDRKLHTGIRHVYYFYRTVCCPFHTRYEYSLACIYAIVSTTSSGSSLCLYLGKSSLQSISFDHILATIIMVAIGIIIIMGKIIATIRIRGIVTIHTQDIIITRAKKRSKA